MFTNNSIKRENNSVPWHSRVKIERVEKRTKSFYFWKIKQSVFLSHNSWFFMKIFLKGERFPFIGGDKEN